MYASGCVELAHVIRIQVAVFIGDNEVQRLHGVPGHSVAPGLHDKLADRRVVAQVVQRDAAIAARARKDVRLRLHCRPKSTPWRV